MKNASSKTRNQKEYVDQWWKQIESTNWEKLSSYMKKKLDYLTTYLKKQSNSLTILQVKVYTTLTT